MDCILSGQCGMFSSVSVYKKMCLSFYSKPTHRKKLEKVFLSAASIEKNSKKKKNFESKQNSFRKSVIRIQYYSVGRLFMCEVPLVGMRHSTVTMIVGL